MNIPRLLIILPLACLGGCAIEDRSTPDVVQRPTPISRQSIGQLSGSQSPAERAFRPTADELCSGGYQHGY